MSVPYRAAWVNAWCYSPGRTVVLPEIKPLNGPSPPPLNTMITTYQIGCHLPLRARASSLGTWTAWQGLVSVCKNDIRLNKGAGLWGEQGQGAGLTLLWIGASNIKRHFVPGLPEICDAAQCPGGGGGEEDQLSGETPRPPLSQVSLGPQAEPGTGLPCGAILNLWVALRRCVS